MDRTLAAIDVADCACALVFHWITQFGVPATITLIVDSNLLQVCGLCCVCLESHTARPELTTERQTVQ
jgi:hypothetical protein